MSSPSEQVHITVPLEDPKKIVVIVPGSSNLRIGLASEEVPHYVPHVIARKLGNPKSIVECNVVPPSQHVVSERRFAYIKQDLEVHGHFSAPEDTPGEPYQYNGVWYTKENCGLDDPVDTQQREIDETLWTNTDSQPSFVVGKEALNLRNDGQYIQRYPIREGYFAIIDQNSVYSSREEIRNDLCDIWKYYLENLMKIPFSDFHLYSVALVVPDIFIRDEVQDLVDICLRSLNFKQIVLHQESVCTTFGVTTPLACVVDIGEHSTKVSCVDEGVILPGTSIYVPYGGYHITKAFLWLLTISSDGYFPYEECDLRKPFDLQLLQDLKERHCHMYIDPKEAVKVLEFHIRGDRQKPPRLLKMNSIEEVIIAPMALFHPKLFDLTQQHRQFHYIVSSQTEWKSNGISFLDSFDGVDDDFPEDEHPDRFKRVTEMVDGDKYPTEQLNAYTGHFHRYTAIREMVKSVGGEDMSVLPGILPQVNEFDVATPDSPLSVCSITDAILRSVSRVARSDISRRLFSNIIASGGAALTKGFSTALTARLREANPDDGALANVNVNPKNFDSRYLSWNGATILGITEASGDFWISKSEWETHGTRVFREKLPFAW